MHQFISSADTDDYSHIPTTAYHNSTQISSKKHRLNKKQQKIDQGKKIGHWTFQEKKRYYQFLDLSYRHFSDPEMRKLDKIFKLMAAHVVSRGPDQCRSHHQKVLKKYGSLQNIISGMNLYFNDMENRIKCKNPKWKGDNKKEESIPLILQNPTTFTFQETPIYLENGFFIEQLKDNILIEDNTKGLQQKQCFEATVRFYKEYLF